MHTIIYAKKPLNKQFHVILKSVRLGL